LVHLVSPRSVSDPAPSLVNVAPINSIRSRSVT